MKVLALVNSYGARAFEWRDRLTWVQKAGLAVLMACLVGLMAQVRLPVPWSPVPVTGQTFGVFLAAVLLGRNWGGLSIGFYALAGALGLPWFAGWSGGLVCLAGPTGGYIAGFVIAAFIVGYMVDKFVWVRKFPYLLGLLLAANFVVIHGLGLLHLGAVTGTMDLKALLWMGTIPFIAGDITKVLAVAAIASVLLPDEETSRHNS
ncbi:MAG: biotin transporter BioY [Peptococcaceae bacterium]|nr:biotin transporter BioY [Peptococcaceae bacterium]